MTGGKNQSWGEETALSRSEGKLEFRSSISEFEKYLQHFKCLSSGIFKKRRNDKTGCRNSKAYFQTLNNLVEGLSYLTFSHCFQYIP